MIQPRPFALAARVFTTAALVSLASVSGPGDLYGALVLVPLALVAQVATLRVDATVVATAEAAIAALVSVLSWPGAESVTLPYLVVPVLIAAVDRGRAGMLLILATELAALSASWLVLVHQADRMMLGGVVTWTVTGAGIGLLGTAFRSVAGTEHDAAYREATQLIRQLSALSGRLGDRLDVAEAADHVLAEADEHLPVSGAVVVAHDGERPSRLLRSSPGARPDLLARAEPFSEEGVRTATAGTEGPLVTFPLRVGPETIGVLVVECVRVPSEEAQGRLRTALTGAALRLQAALLFDGVRDSATSGERQRISREVHDGVAQDVASLGYLVDEIAQGATDPGQREQIRTLREALTLVIAELRRSVFELRHDQPAGQGLGESLSAFARHVGSVSAFTVHVTLDERGPRLDRDVEHQLLRIAQEAMTNARKHATGGNLWLDCTVRAPTARVEVRDDGSVPHAPSAHSQGMSIMRERAESIGAELVVDAPSAARPGTRVVVSLRGHGSLG